MTHRKGLSAAVALAALLALPRPTLALFHLAVVDEVLSSYGGDATQQFVEVRMLANAQNFVTNSVLASFDTSGTYIGDIFVVPNQVGDGTAGKRWIMATSAFQSAHGFTADFTMPAGIPIGGGMICWGAPFALPPAPSTWNHALLRACSNNGFQSCTTDGDCTSPGFCQNSYVDCLAYGTYAGSSNLLTGTPTTAKPEGTSLVRVNDTHDNATAFTCGSTITPTNNAGGTVSLAGTVCCEGLPCIDADGNPCTSGLCTAGTCTPQPSSGAACDDADADPCTNGVCVSGSCVSGTQPQPTGCLQPATAKKASLVVKDNAVDSKDVLVWKWVKGAALTTGDFGDPLATDAYTLCVYEKTGPSETPNLAFKLTAPAGGTCPTKPCWKAYTNGSGFTYADPQLTPDGARALVLKSGAATMSKITAKGLGPLLNVAGASLPLETPVTVQLKGAGKCFEAHFSNATASDATQFKAKAD